MQIEKWFLDTCEHHIDAVVLEESVCSRDISFCCHKVGHKCTQRLGIPISGLSYICGDNMPVVHNTSRSESVLRKKSNSVCYHAVCESVAMGESLVKHTPSKENVTNLMTKVLYGQKIK